MTWNDGEQELRDRLATSRAANDEMAAVAVELERDRDRALAAAKELRAALVKCRHSTIRPNEVEEALAATAWLEDRGEGR